jgi:DNA-directed RNA polymerase subunit beta'
VAYLDPRESSDHLRDQTLEALKTHFPIKGSTHTVELASLSVGDGLDPDDIRQQHKAKVEGGSFAVPVHGHLRLIENSTGNVVDEKKLRLVDLPQMTSRYSYIVGGKEYQVSNQWQLKPGAYTHRGKDGQLKTQFNVVNKSPLALSLHPESGGVKMEYRSAELPVYPMLRALGVTDTEVEKRLGKDFLAANKGARGESGAIAQFYKSSTKKDAPDEHTALKHFVDQMADSKLDPTATKHTLGAAVDHVSGDALLRAIERLHKVHNGAPEDDKDSLVFKNLRSTGDYAADKIREHGKAVRSRVGRQINASTKLRQIIPPGLFNAPIRDTFTDNAASELAAQINPVEMLGKNSQTTVLGPGGISSEQQILDSVKLINQSHMAFQDTVVTPESSRTGVNLRLPMGLKKIGTEAKVHLHNIRTGKTELVDAAKFLTSNVVLPDQVSWKNGKPVPLGDSVRVAGEGNHFKDVPFSKADYVLRHPSQLFSSTTNLIPFLGSVSGNRASMATRHIEQAISLVDREPPLVQAATGSEVHGIHTFDEVLGKHAAHVSPVHGTVTSVQPDGIHIRTASGSKEVQLYNNFPLNDAKSVLHSTPIVKVGDKVAKGQVLADTNYSKNGVLALGRNLRTAYLDFKGLNYEDGLVISETAAKKLSSHHMYKDTVQLSPETILDRKKFLDKLPGLYNVKTQVGHLGEDGVVLVGSKVKPGDPLVLAMKPYDLKSRTNDKAYQKALLGTHTDNSLRWHGEVEGEVVSVHRQDGAVHVHVRTVEPAKVGDKASARSANKGVISAILPDKDMPHSRDGAPLEILMSPLGVPGRMNPSQILETAAGKIAMKTGKPYIVPNFKPGMDAVSHVQAELKKHGLSDTEELVDPASGHSLGQVMTGYQHVLKLVHQSDKKLSVTSGMGLPGVQGGDTYDNNLQPKSGQRLGSLGTYAMLAHGSVHNLREFQALKGEGADPETDERKRWNSAHLDIWNAIQTGSPLPTPKKSFAFHKFEEMLRGSGINVEKKGHEVFVTPLTDKHVLELAGSRVITKPGELLNARVDKHSGEMVPKAGGLFDTALTGGHNGKRWSRFPLAEPMPNPIFEKPIKSLTGLSGAQFDGLLAGTHSVTSDGKVVAGLAGPHRGGHAIEHLLKKIDVAKELENAKDKLSKASASKVDECLKRVKYLNALSVTGTTANEAYVMKNIAVIPPAFRPASILNDGKNIDYADVNELYKSAGIVNTKLSDPQLRHAPEEQSKLRVDLYKRIAGISGYGIPFGDAKHKGLLHTIAGAQPKGGMFQKRITQKRQDLSMAAVVIPEPSLGLNEVGFPREAALDLFRPFVVRKLQEMGHASNPLEAQKVLALRGPASFAALQKVVEERPTLLKRDPSLHKYSIQGFDVKLTTGNAIKLHPLVCGGFTADFDGDVMRAYVPISKDAISEVHRMKPTNNLFSEASNRLMYVPTLGSALGIYKTSLPGKDTGKEFSSHGHVVEAARDRSITVNDIVTVGGKKTTAGRVLLSMTLPQALQGEVLHDIHKPLDSKALDSLLTRLGKDHHADFDKSVNMIKDVGYHASFGVIPVPGMSQGKEVYIPVGAHSLSLKDLQTHSSVRDGLLASAHSDVAKIRKTDGHTAAADARVVDRYQKAETAMKSSVMGVDPLHGSNLHTMFKAGVKPGWDQYKQLVFAPMLLKDSTGRTIPTPVTRSYSEGLDVSGYWTQMHGARSGSVQKVQAVQDPGYLSKLLMQSSVDTLVSSPDCGTKKGVLLPVADDDVHDRVLAADYRTDKLHIPAGTLLSPRTVGQIRAVDHTAKLLVRSPMRCEHGEGICQKCAGLSSSGQHHPIGANIGVHAAQAVGERAVQLMLKAFHQGGVAVIGGGSKTLGAFDRLNQLTGLPENIPHSATLAMRSGKVEGIKHTPTGVHVTVAGKSHFVGKDPSGHALHEPHAASDWAGLKVGQHVAAGDHLSDPHRTVVNPHHLYEATGSMERVQNHLADEVFKLYKGEGILRKHVEVVVRNMSNLTKVTDPGDASGVLRGEFKPASSVHALNKHLLAAGRQPVEHTPVLRGVSTMPQAIQEDWMAKLQHMGLRSTLVNAAAEGAVSHLHGAHPIPGLAYGAEFGLNKAHSNLPGRRHLADVKEHHY